MKFSELDEQKAAQAGIDAERFTNVRDPIEEDDQRARERISRRSLSEDREYVGDVAAGIVRARGEQRQETGGPETYLSDRNLQMRSEEIAETVGDMGGSDLLGLRRTGYSIGKSIVDNIYASVNAVLVPLGVPEQIPGGTFLDRTRDARTGDVFTEESAFLSPQKLGKRKEYEKFYDKRIKEGASGTRAYFDTVKKVFNETPELKNEGLFVAETINRAAGKEVIGVREADEITGYWRPEATTREQILRAIPELVGGTVAGVKFLTRGSKKLIKQSDRIMKEEFGKDSVFDATEEELAKVIAKIMDEKAVPISDFLGFGRIRREMFGRSRLATIRIKKVGGLKAVPKKLVSNTIALQQAKKKLKSARTKNDSDLISRESAALTAARNKRLQELPKELVEIPLTEAGAVAGSIIGGNVFGEEYGQLFGALGGGFGSAIAFDRIYNFTSGAGRGIGSLVFGLGAMVGALDDNQLKLLAEKGVLPKLGKLTRRQQGALKDFSLFIRSLPQEQRERLYSTLRLVGEIRDELKGAGISEEVLQTTIGKATGIIPLMLMRDALADTRKLGTAGGLSKLHKKLSAEIDSQYQIEEQVREFRGLLERLAGEAESAGIKNSKFNDFINAMQTNSAIQVKELENEKGVVENVVREILELARNPSITHNFDDKEALNELTKTLLSTPFLRRSGLRIGPNGEISFTGPVPTDARELQRGVTELQQTVSRRLDLPQEEATMLEQDLSRFLLDYQSPAAYQTDAEAAGKSLGDYARVRKEGIVAKAKARFEALKSFNSKFDITSWVDEQYGPAGIIAGSRKEKVKQVLQGGKNVQGVANSIEALANIEGRELVEEAIENNRELKQILLDDYNALRRENEPPLESVDDIGYRQVKELFELEYKPADFQGQLTDWDVFKIANDVFIPEAGLPKMKVEATLDEIQKYSSNFAEKARNNYDSNRSLSTTMGNLARTIIETVPEEGAEGAAIRNAKQYYIDNVVMRYRDPDDNPIGWNADHFKPNGDYKVPPEEWIDIKGLINGEVQDATKIIKQLETSFGGYYPDTGYVLNEADVEAKKQIKNLLNDLLARQIRQLPVMQQAEEIADPKKVRGVFADAPTRGRKPESILEGQAEQNRKLGVEALRSPALRELSDNGYLDLDQVVEFNLNVANRIGNTKRFKRLEEQVDGQIENAQVALRTKVNTMENFLKNMIKFTPEQEGANVTDYDRFVDFFILSPQASDRIDTILPQVAKQMKLNPFSAKDVLAEVAIEAIARHTAGDIVETGTVQATRTIDTERLVNLFLTPEYADVTKQLLGEEKFSSAKRLAQFLMIQDRDLRAKLMSSGVSITTPKGLSPESLLSRGYSISRGVISPKYVATEIALLSFRKRKANALSAILNDPDMVDAVIGIVDSGGLDIRKYNSNLFTTLINGLAAHEVMRKNRDRKEQIIQLELDKLRR